MSATEARRRVSYIAAIDGLRALAIAAVVVYHLDLPFLGGGFLGVDVFFVISGFVITRLLLDSLAEHGTLDLRGFYAARARRLLPGLATVGFVFWIATAVVKPVLTPQYLGDLPFAISGTTNLHLIAQSSDYFAGMSQPSLLQHTWSLAVESQYYLLWPIFILAVLRIFGRSQVPTVAFLLASCSFAAYYFAALDFNVSNQAASHLYFGADTHSLGLLLGSALGVNWIPRNLSRNVVPSARFAIDAAGAVGLIGLLWLFTAVDVPGSFIFSSSFPLAAIFSSLLLAAVVHPAGRISHLFTAGWLRWVGARSYGIYLWHWPIFQLTRPGLDIAGDGIAIESFRLAIVLIAAELSYRFIETPFRRRQPQQWLISVLQQDRRSRVLKLGSLALSCSLGLTGAASLTAHAIAVAPASELFIAEPAAPAWSPTATQSAVTGPGDSQSPTASPTTSPTAPTASPTPSLIASSPAPSETTTPIKYAVFGDSVMLGAKSGVQSAIPVARFMAVVGWQDRDIARAVDRALPKIGGMGVVFNLGNNGYIDEDLLRQMLGKLADQPKVIVVNAAVPRRWQDPNDQLLVKVAADFPNVVLVDWRLASNGHPEYFVADGVHLTRLGIAAYSRLLSDTTKHSG